MAQISVNLNLASFATKATKAKKLTLKDVVLDKNMLAELMIEHDLGVKLEYKYELKKLDGDYFEEDFE